MDVVEATRRATNRDKVALIFKQRPMQWIDWRELQNDGGGPAWRTRISDCRVDLKMRIDNRQYRHANGVVVQSEYRYVPEGQLSMFEGAA